MEIFHRLLKYLVYFALVLYLFEIVCAESADVQDHYKVLGVPKTATDAEIKSAYRKLAKEWHPDRHREERAKNIAQQKFMKISEAYETLSDPQERAAYDDEVNTASRAGRSQPRQDFNGFQQSGPGGFSFEGAQFHQRNRRYRSSKASGFGGGAADDLFSQFGSLFEGFGGAFGQEKQQQQHRQPVHEHKLLEQLFKVSDIKVLDGNQIKESLGKSYRGNNIWIVLMTNLYLNRERQNELDRFKKLAQEMMTLSERFNSAMHFAVVDCNPSSESFSGTQKLFCSKYISDGSSGQQVLLKAFSPYDKLNSLEYKVSLQDSNGPSKFLREVSKSLPEVPFERLKGETLNHLLIHKAKSCLKDKDAPLGCAFLITDKITSKEMISWKMTFVQHKLKQRAELHVINVNKQDSTMKLPQMAVIRNIPSNRADITVKDSFEFHAVEGTSFQYLSDLITKEIWLKSN